MKRADSLRFISTRSAVKCRRHHSSRRTLGFLALESRVCLSPFTVTTNADDGPGSLRQAIIDANSANGGSIDFAIQGSGPFVISPASSLPAITRPVVIDGSSEHDFAGNPLIEIAGAGLTAAGLSLPSLSAESYRYSAECVSAPDHDL